MKTYRRHNCTRNHRTTHALAKCIFRKAAWVQGTGEYACLAWCRVLTVQLYPTQEAALAAKAIIDNSACGGLCHGKHEVVKLVNQ